MNKVATSVEEFINLLPSKRELYDWKTNAMESAYLDGNSQKEVAEMFGVSQPLVSRRLRMLGTPMRDAPISGWARGEGHGQWKGGRVANGGYVMVRASEERAIAWAMRRVNGYVFEHRLVMAEYLGRPLAEFEQVHHINGVRTDNRIENLQLRVGNHGSGVALQCRTCGSSDLIAVPLHG